MAECIKKVDSDAMIHLIDRAFLEMTKRVAQIDLVSTTPVKMNMSQCSSLIIETSGDYNAKLIVYADNLLLKEVARRMKRGIDPSSEDIVIYTTEYYNILCGFLISHLNSNHQLKARFGIPTYITNCVKGTWKPSKEDINTCYKCEYGRLWFQGMNLPINK